MSQPNKPTFRIYSSSAGSGKTYQLTMLTRLALLLLLCLSSNTLFAQTQVSPKTSIKKTVRQMARVGILKCELVGRAPIKPQQYLRFDLLRKQCTDAELTALLKHRAPVVRAYAFQALSERSESDLLPLLLQQRRDTAKFAQQCGCIGSTTTVVESMLQDYEGSPQYAQDTLSTERKTLAANMSEESIERFAKVRATYKRSTEKQRRELIREARLLKAHDENY
ncbi:hypothetical protein [Hymenobacter terrestris]|uniref:HEAT repeat domain-containing protein n=1 Tax=Hymenobacter terrestris TaxID=2748310 RepID=A0ABX2Q2Q4_9BACT|nr:hypothetical protein [Hymenobacter terrestris]NVO84600.1 hypothetical protein [Hymenobacter terrestris]